MVHAPFPAPGPEVVVRILIVDDQPAVAEALGEAVRRQGCEAIVTYGGEDGLAAIRASVPDGVFLDLVMPEMGGVEVLRRIRAEWPELPVVLVTGYPGGEDIEEARQLGVLGVVEKPLVIKNLPTVLDDLRGR